MSKTSDAKVKARALAWREALGGERQIPAENVRGMFEHFASGQVIVWLREALGHEPTEADVDLWWTSALDGW